MRFQFARSTPQFLRRYSQDGRRDRIANLGDFTCRFSSLADASEFDDGFLNDDKKIVQKEAALRQALSQLASDFSKESRISLQKIFGSRRTPVISTGSLKLDQILGIGGLPKGRMVEIYGREASGKTTLALHVIKEAQKLGGYCAYLDAENAMDPSLAESMGINTEDLLVARPDSAENLLCMVDTLTKSESVNVIVVDSVAALVPQMELDTSGVVPKRDMQSQIMTQALRKINNSLSRSQTLIIFLNQVRFRGNSGQNFRQTGEVTCGGNALKFYAAVRLRMIRTGLIKTGDKATGLGVCVEVVKNKLSPIKKKAELEIQFGRGICRESEVLDLACEHGLIIKEGSTYFLGGSRGTAFDDKQAAQQYLAEHYNVVDKLVADLRMQLFE